MKRIITHRSKVVLALAVLLAVGMTAVSASVALAVEPGLYTPTSDSFDTANCPTGSCKLSSGSPSCTVNANFSIDCSAYVLGGVGNTNADVLLTANYLATIDCTNKGGNLVESHTTSITPSSMATVTPSRNGQLSVEARSVSFSGAPVGCPNPNWTPTIRPGSVTLTTFSYTLTFAGFDDPFIEISEP